MIVAHELAHLKAPEHDKAFYQAAAGSSRPITS